MCSARRHRRTCMSQERRLYFLYLLGVEGWSLGSLRCLTEGKNSQTDPRCSISIHKSTFSPGHLQQVVLVPAGVLAILDLFLPPLYNCGVGLGVGRIWEAGVAATERRPAEVKQVRKHELQVISTRVKDQTPDLLPSMSSVPTATLLVDTLRMQRSKMDGLRVMKRSVSKD